MRRPGYGAGVKTLSVLVLGVVIGMSAGGCGVGDDRAAARAAAERFYMAIGDDDGAAACQELGEDTVKELESQSGDECAEAVTQLELEGAAVTRVDVYATSAQVELESGESAFLSPEGTSWRLSAVGCKPEEGKPRDRPLDCELEA